MRAAAPPFRPRARARASGAPWPDVLSPHVSSVRQEAIACGAPSTLESALRASLSRGAEETFLSALSSSLASLCGEGAAQVRVRRVRFSSAWPTVLVREGALGDGLGARLWGSSFFLCRVFAAMDPRAMAQETVLELGTGVGLLGCVASLCGASHVVMSDGELGALHVARATMAMHQAKHIDGCDDQQAVKSVQSTDELPWEVADGALRVRRLDWRDDRRRLEANGAAMAHATTCADVPELPADATFTWVVGSELLYDVACAEACAASCARRLAPGGRAHVVGAVRDRAYLAGFLQQARRWHLRTCVRPLDPDEVVADADGRTLGLRRSSDYEGGYVEILMDRRDAPHDWDVALAFQDDDDDDDVAWR